MTDKRPDDGVDDAGESATERDQSPEPDQAPESDQTPEPDQTARLDPAGQTDPVQPGPGQPDHTEQFEPVPPSSPTHAYSQQSTPTARFDHGPETSRFDDGFTPVAAGVPGATEPGAPVPGVVTTSSPSRRNRGKILGVVALALVLLLVIAGVGSELYLRKRTQGCLEDAFAQLTGTDTSVSFSRTPMLIQAMGDEIPFVQVDTADDSSNGMRLHARAEGVSESDGATSVRSLNGTGFLPFERVLALGNEAAASTPDPGTGAGGTGEGLVNSPEIRSITGNAADGTITIESAIAVTFLKIPVSTTIKPVTDNGRVRFDVERANVLVFGIPADYAQQIVDQVSDSLFGPFFDEVSVDELKVTDTGVDFRVSGSDVQLVDSQGGNTQAIRCG